MAGFFRGVVLGAILGMVGLFGGLMGFAVVGLFVLTTLFIFPVMLVVYLFFENEFLRETLQFWFGMSFGLLVFLIFLWAIGLIGVVIPIGW